VKNLKVLPAKGNLQPYEVVNALVEKVANMSEVIVLYVEADTIVCQSSYVDDFDCMIGHLERMKHYFLRGANG
jgi:hypothetical protein